MIPQHHTIAVEDAHLAPFFNKTPISIERGEGIYVWDEDGRKYVDSVAAFIYENLKALQQTYPGLIRTVRGKGLLLAMEVIEPSIAAEIVDRSLGLGLFVNLIRIFPALNIRREEAQEGLELLKRAIGMVADNGSPGSF